MKISNYIPTSIKSYIKYYLNDLRNLKDNMLLPFSLLKESLVKKFWLSKEEIKQYREKIKIYDVFLFYNELELLEIRLNILDKYVDYFVIVEATKTFTGLSKKLYFEENKHIFKRWEGKIIHYVVEDTPEGVKNLERRLFEKDLSELDRKIIETTLTTKNIPDKTQLQWIREFYQKEMALKPLVGLSDDDFCYISDLDEIWDPRTIIDYSKNNIFKFKLTPYVYYLNNRSNENWKGWVGTVATKYINIKNIGINHTRTHRGRLLNIIRKGGWHFTFQGGTKMIKQKLESYSHQEINTEKIKLDMENIVLKNKDIRGRHIKFWKDETNLPEYILQNKKKYTELLRM